MKQNLKFLSISPAVTKKFAERFIEDVFQKHKDINNALIIALDGELGAGKTVFVQGLVKALKIRKKITSPTFVLMRRYEINLKNFKNFFHIDAYRLQNKSELAGIGFNEIFKDASNIVIVEWASNIRKILPKGITWIKIEHGEEENERIIRVIK